MTRYSLNKTKFLSDSELQVLNKELDANESTDARNVTLIRLALATGARAIELLRLTSNDLNDETHSVLIRGAKKSNDREIPLNQKLFMKLKGLGDGRLFPISYQRLNQIWNLYRPCKKGFHSLRHTVGLRVYSKHRDIKLVQTVLGHRNIANTMIYADYHFSIRELRRLLY